MKNTMLLAAMLAMAVMMMAAPLAVAQDGDDRREERLENRLDRFFDLDDDNGFFFNPFVDFFFGGDAFGDFEQESESGDVVQDFNVSSTGDNSNQCVGIQGVANTGNAQNQIGITQIGSDADDFEFDDVGSSIDVSPNNSTTCDQQVNQAASASG